MAVKIYRNPNPEFQMERVVLVDHFGFEHDMTIHAVVLRETAPGVFEPQIVDPEPYIATAKEMHERREALHLEYMMKHHPDHPATKGHPDHPDNKLTPLEMFAWPKPKNCRECK